jgi:hypothetical protein
MPTAIVGPGEGRGGIGSGRRTRRDTRAAARRSRAIRFGDRHIDASQMARRGMRITEIGKPLLADRWPDPNRAARSSEAESSGK